MKLRGIGLWLTLAVLGAGCQENTPPDGATPPTPHVPAADTVLALQPLPGAIEVTLTPHFMWKLPQHADTLTSVSFKLAELGSGDTPPDATNEEAGELVAICSGLHETSPTELDLFHPPAGATLTGAVREMQALKPGTWYRWTVRAINDEGTSQKSFLFRTQPQP